MREATAPRTTTWELAQRRRSSDDVPAPDARRPLVVGIDGSQPSLHALAWALGEAAGRQAPLRVVTVWAWDRGSWEPEAARQAREQQEAAVVQALGLLPADRAHTLRRAGVVTELVHGDPASRLIERSGDADLLVLADHGRHWVEEENPGPQLGSVAEVCIRHAACPVVVVPARSPMLTCA